jgi:hypothetical protein
MDAQSQSAATDTPVLKISDRISIVNALLAQDRQEVRGHQEALLRLSYIMVPAFIAVSVFFDAHRHYRTVLVIGDLLLLLLYVVVYLVTFRIWLRDARACQNIREAFYQRESDLLYRDPFGPLRPITPEDYKRSIVDRYLWFPFGVTLAVAVVTLAFILLSTGSPIGTAQVWK